MNAGVWQNANVILLPIPLLLLSPVVLTNWETVRLNGVLRLNAVYSSVATQPPENRLNNKWSVCILLTLQLCFLYTLGRTKVSDMESVLEILTEF